MVSRASGNPAVRQLVAGAVIAAVLLGDGLVLVGYTTQIRGQALSAPAAGTPGSSPEAAAPVPLSPPLLPEGSQAPSVPMAPRAEPPAAPAAPPPPNAAAPPNAATRPENPRPPSSGTPGRWPGSLPDPDAVARDQAGRSPFTQRCASGEISARWCSGFPGEHE